MKILTLDKILISVDWCFFGIGICLCSIHCQQEIADNKEERLKSSKEQIASSDTLSFIIDHFTDSRDQVQYEWIQLANGQKWMTQNLNFKTPMSTCYDGVSDCPIFGQLYSWKEAKSACCLLYTSPSPRDATLSRMPSSA